MASTAPRRVCTSQLWYLILLLEQYLVLYDCTRERKVGTTGNRKNQDDRTTTVGVEQEHNEIATTTEVSQP